MAEQKDENKRGVGGGEPRLRGRPRHDDVLTPMEWRVLHGAQHGSTNKAIAASLGISADGVKYHMTNILGKLNLANRQQLKTWFQAPRDSAMAQPQNDSSGCELKEGRYMTENEQTTALNGLGQVARTVRSLEESLGFYRDKLGIAHLYSFGNLGFFDLAGTRLFLNETEALNENESILYFSVTDINTTCATLAERGVEISNQPHLIHTHDDGSEEWMAFLKDPEGRALGLMSTVRKSA